MMRNIYYLTKIHDNHDHGQDHCQEKDDDVVEVKCQYSRW